MKKVFAIGVVLAATALVAPLSQAAGQRQQRTPDPRTMGGGDCRDNVYNCVNTPNPLPTANTVWLEEMTWMDVRDALALARHGQA